MFFTYLLSPSNILNKKPFALSNSGLKAFLKYFFLPLSGNFSPFGIISSILSPATSIPIEQDVKSYKKIRIDEAKELYIKAINTTDEELRKLYLDKIILGTLYVIYNYVDNNNYDLIFSSSYDKDDIVNSFIELWIRKIKEGALLNANSYSMIINKTFIKQVNNILVSDEMFKFENNLFVDLFHIFISFKNSGKNFNYKDIVNEYNKTYGNHLYYYKEMDYMFAMFETIYNRLNFNKDEDLKMTRRNIDNLIELLINNGLFDKLSNNELESDFSDDVNHKVMVDNFMKIIENKITSERARSILHQYYGLDDEEPKTLEDVAKSLNLSSRERARRIKYQTISKLRCPSIIKYVRG